MIKDMEAGRSCTDNRQCKSNMCNTKVEPEVCVSGNITASCNAHYQCGMYDSLHLGCITSREWPYKSQCEQLGTEGKYCLDDYDCEIDHYCWYMSSQDAKADSKKCMKLYEQPDFTKFGYKKQMMSDFRYNYKENM